MLMPIIAIALVRCCSRVRSESSAITAAEIAPAPCRTRPAITPQMESALAARAAPAAKISSPDDDHRAPADAVGNGPEGNLQDRLGQAIGADGQADQRRGRAGQVLAVGGQHRQDHEHAEHAEGEYQ